MLHFKTPYQVPPFYSVYDTSEAVVWTMKTTWKAKTRKAQCPFCPKAFTRTEHLQRHLGSHGVGKAVTCPECGKDFMRKDVLKRHLDKCQYKPKDSVAVTAHISCSSSCSTDTSSRFEPVSTDPPINAQPLLSSSSGRLCSVQPDIARTANDTRLAFPPAPTPREETLWSDINFDNIHFLFDNSVLDKDNALQIQNVSAPPAPSGFGVPCLNVDPADTFNFLARISNEEAASLETRYGSALPGRGWMDQQSLVHDTDTLHSRDNGMPECSRDLPSTLARQSHSIVSQIKSVSQNSPITPPWTSHLEKTCNLFFSPRNIVRFVEIYWTAWHPHYPVIHKPTFSISTTPVHLLASMCIMGALFSPNENDKISARIWLNGVEELIFSNRYFGDVLLLDEATVDVRDAVQHLQAAYCISTAQISEGSKISRRRMRRLRFGAVVSLARDLNLFNIAHRDLDRLQRSDFSWDSFVATEECIRTMLFIYANDTGFAIFSNYPPRTRIQEMSVDVVCPEVCFQASSAQECFAAIKTWTSHPSYRQRLRLRDTVESLLCRDGSPDIQDYLSHLGVLNLWIICSALIAEAFNLNTLVSSTSSSLHPTRRAIHTWKLAWNQRYAIPDNFGLPKEEDQILDRAQDAWRRVGFFQNASEYWLLLHIFIQRIEKQQGARRERVSGQSSVILNGSDERSCDGPYRPSNCDSPTMADLKGLILEHHRTFQAFG
ncbi:FTFMHR domain-containing protein [Aspergillus stella-maris]|uniref:FTFMHR domain-containing protein n=1 Tax=Aspergillus stella-maris TaxID=1810926 RepID=UPI003CCC9721